MKGPFGRFELCTLCVEHLVQKLLAFLQKPALLNVSRAELHLAHLVVRSVDRHYAQNMYLIKPFNAIF